ncbi:Leucine Rich Repeat family protein [Trichomonas vaginalis G3]|uniref:Leucine Rich Repeat family protein n=1 Tax=Trichomonas vaginalis (strain ATCC PRA-98 / G3) TaxID=412133 RepID=A2ERM9_TRIV3|nr:uncharacterized protein TVAGG3_0345030 [Trichomonas vaginalis G3]EAY04681.1 Leucine Rich Repeat family protein [Trichomonas vaginalis G3]KAI5530910.1 expressed protein family [Trichomonas vaginalis G3]|eukprot:XP_001316904.1 hypothetical protein [Trichomonas vaginalis G3]
MSSSPSSSTSSIFKILSPGDMREIPSSVSENTLHLDVNSNKIISFPDRLHSLISLNISSNPITVSTLGELQNLRSLSLDFCDIKKFKGFPSFPQLSYLSLVGNQITNLKDFPLYPNLTSIDFRGNPLKYDEYLLIAAIASHNLSTINNVKIQEKTFRKAFAISQLIGYSIRNGNKLIHDDDDLDSALDFLSGEQPLKIIDSAQTKSLVPNREANTFKWYYLENNSWIDLDCPTRTLPITPFLSLKLIKCDFDGFTSYTANPVGWDGETPVAFHNVTAEIIGDVIPGNIITTNVNQAKITWKIDDNEISHDSICKIPLETEGKILICYASPISDAFPSVEFSSVASSVTIQQNEIEILEFSVPDNPEINTEYKINLQTFPPDQKLKVTIEISDDVLNDFVESAQIEYPYNFSIPENFGGKFIRAKVNIDGQELFSYSKERVKDKMLKSIDANIVGSYLAGHPHILLFREKDLANSCKIEWFTLSEDGVYMNYINDSLIFTPPINTNNSTICVHIIPDENHSEYSETVIETPIPLRESSELIIAESQLKPIEGSKIEMDTEGQWQITNDLELVDLDYSDKYTPQNEDVGEYLRFFTSDNKIDIVFGLVSKNNFNIKSVTLETDGGDYVGALCQVFVDFYDKNDNYKIEWVRVLRGGDTKIAKEGGDNYAISHEDIGCKIKAKVRTDKGEVKDSNITPMIRSGLYKSQILPAKLQVNSKIKIDSDKGRVTFLRSLDGLSWEEIGNTKNLTVIWSDIDHFIRIIVKTKKFVYYEDSKEKVTPIKIKSGSLLKMEDIFRKSDTRTMVRWYDQNNSIISEQNFYTIKNSDKNLTAVNYNPNDKDDYEICQISNIISLDSPLRLEILPSGSLSIVGEQITDEGKYFWRIWQDGYCDDIDNGGSKSLILLPSMIGSEIEGGYRANDDSDIIWVKEKYLVERALPQPNCFMTEEEKLSVGSQLFVSTEDNPQYKYKFEWKRWDGNQFIQMEDETNVHIITEDDCNCYVCCDVRFVDKDGFLGPPFTVRTSDVVPPDRYIMIEGRSVVSALLNATSNDDFVKNCRIEWQTLHDGFNWTTVSTRTKYRPTRDDVGALIRVVGYMDDEQRTSNEIGPVEDDKEEINSAISHAVKNGLLTVKCKDQIGNTFNLDITRKGFSVKSNKSNNETYNWRPNNNILPTPGSSRKIDVVMNGTTLSLLPLDTDPLDCDLKTYREFILSVVSSLKGQ